MKIILEHSDIDRAIQNFLRDEMNLDVDEVHKIELSLDADGHASALVTNAKPRATPREVAVQQPQPAPAGPPAPTTAPVTAPVGASGPKPLDQAIDEQRKGINWQEEALGTTDLSALGKTDTSDFSDEVVGRAVPFAARS